MGSDDGQEHQVGRRCSAARPTATRWSPAASVYVGTNNGAGYLKRYPADVDLGCLIAFDEKNGKFLWQHSSEKLPTGRVHDWPLMGICCSPLVEGDALWFVTSRGEVKCLDTEGYYDGEDDGPIKNETAKLFEVHAGRRSGRRQGRSRREGARRRKAARAIRKRFAEAGFELPESVDGRQ